jgi:hypothetical protein
MSDDGTASTTATQATAQNHGTPPGWYADPQGAMRWWDGAAWTAHVAPGSASSVIRTATILSTESAAQPGAVAAQRPVAGSGRLANLPALPQLSRRAWIVAGSVVGVLVLLAGYLLFGRGGEDAGQVTGTPSLTPTQKAAEVNLHQGDVPPTLKVVPAPKATALTGAGSTSLSLCGGHFVSEGHRVARSNVMVTDTKGNPTGVQQESIVYAGPTWAATALAEWRKAAAGCSTKAFRVYPELGSTPVRFVAVSTATSRSLPAKNNLVTRFQLQVKGSTTALSFVVVLQQSGDTVDAVVDVAPSAASAAQKKSTETAVGVISRVTGTALVAHSAPAASASAAPAS